MIKKVPKPRDINHITLQLKGLMRTKVIKNKKKEVKKFNWKKESSYYSSIFKKLSKMFQQYELFI